MTVIGLMNKWLASVPILGLMALNTKDFFNQGKMDGIGTLKLKDGTTIIGTWKENLLSGVSSVQNSDGNMQTIKWENGSILSSFYEPDR